MANPLNVACPVDTWTKVATAVTTCDIEIVKDSAHHTITYRLTGGAVPTGAFDGTFVDEWIKVRHAAAVDVYVYAKGEAGEVRVYA